MGGVHTTRIQMGFNVYFRQYFESFKIITKYSNKLLLLPPKEIALIATLAIIVAPEMHRAEHPRQ